MLFQVGLVLLALYAGGVLAHRLRQPLVPFYILAGLAIQPWVPRAPWIEVMAQMGVMLLLFMIGLEFSPERARRGGWRFLASGFIDIAVNLPFGVVLGLVFGLDLFGSLLLGGILYISSSAIIARLITELRRAAHPETEYVLGVLVFEDIFIALYLSLLAGLIHAGSLQPIHILSATVKTIGFFAVVFAAAVGLRTFLHRMLAHESIEVFLLLVLALMMLLSATAEYLGLSAAVGAFLAGLIIPEELFRERVDRTIAPFRDLFSAVFFVSFGLLLDYRALTPVVGLGLVLTAVAIGGKLGTGWLIGRVFGLSTRTAARLGVALIPRGEFSIVLAGLATGDGAASLAALTLFCIFMLAIIGPVLMKRIG